MLGYFQIKLCPGCSCGRLFDSCNSYFLLAVTLKVLYVTQIFLKKQNKTRKEDQAQLISISILIIGLIDLC